MSSKIFHFKLIKKLFKNTCRFQVHLKPYNQVCVSFCSTDSHSSNWESVVGLEIHAQINAKSKLFSSSAALFKASTNSQVHYFDAALPGCLPMLNRYCVEAGILTALALDCKINKISTFDRKHYFYPDLPAGYQITQQFQPLAKKGQLKFSVYDEAQRNILYEKVGYLTQLQLEQDSGKSFHIEGQRSFVDLNRAGIGLMELVFEPNLKNGIEAAGLVNELILVLKSLGVCTCQMEDGALRVDANISVNPSGEPFGVKTEVKNINSLRYIAKAIDYEIERQIKVLESGGFVSNETRAFDHSLKKTIFMRDKETLLDYRFMPEPNLPPIELFDDTDSNIPNPEEAINIDDLRRKLPCLPSVERAKLINNYGIPCETADKLLTIEGVKTIFEDVASRVQDKNILAYILLNSVQHQVNVRKLSFLNCPVTNEQIGDVAELFEQRTISEATANDILEMLCNGDPRPAKTIVTEYKWHQICEGPELDKLCQAVMIQCPKLVRKFRNTGKKRYLISLVKCLNKDVNDRACIKDTEDTFIRLIKGLSKTDLEKFSKQPEKLKDDEE